MDACIERPGGAPVSSPYATLTNSNLIECHQTCQQDTRCNYANLDEGTNDCKLYDSSGVSETLQNSIGIPKFCQSSTCFSREQKATGNIVRIYRGAATVEQCQVILQMRQ